MNHHREDEPSLFDGDNPFAGEPNSSRALSWERSHWKLKLQEQAEAHREELATIKSERVSMCRELADALEVGNAPVAVEQGVLTPIGAAMGEAYRLSWSRLLAEVGYLKGKASVGLPAINVVQPAKARRVKR